MNSQQLAFLLVIDEARFLEIVHEKTDPRSRGPYHLCQRIVAYPRSCDLGSMPIIAGEQQENTRQSFLAGVAVMVN